jgi:hypothetical protein
MNNATKAAAETLLTSALAHVESASIRSWATSEHNRPIFIQIAQAAIRKSGGAPDVHMFAAYIVSSAIGL